ncbi:hypothetical protein SODALDRAFT_326506 [Sodiomyces alkalinus F11]|uniref:Thioredoxin-like fold domain-containing protein n=1 Tax=Sodiomyces alkalinus (strain CBS 110278 / VKM F-3762 / F11) TaxID=1314773 RepID=A0A3N2Q6B8_SODAK|nr:hypothetical protein SODALDRAFT_326506 [Sodiomyces alkalinus F11]ROT42329.1 hypothetical protein SODALDRAFT_326506 [Sodiomyces alkalinus F11]
MALPPKFAGHKLLFVPADSKPPAVAADIPFQPHTLELYLDYVCPFSGKFYRTFFEQVVPKIRQNPTWAQGLQVIFRQQIQPWHPSAVLVHEAALAVLRLAPDKFFDFSAELFRVQHEFFDVNVVNEPRNATYARLAEIAGNVGADEAAVLKLLTIPDKPGPDGGLNVGNGVTADVKLIVKLARFTPVHVTPTVVFDGVVQAGIDSSYTVDQWTEWLEKNIAG